MKKQNQIESGYLTELLKTPRGIDSVSVAGFTTEMILKESEVFMALNENEKYATKAQLQYAFVAHIQSIEK